MAGRQSLQPEGTIDRNVGQLHNAARQFPASSMSIFGTASGKQVDEFAIGLARTLAQNYPPLPATGAARPPGAVEKLRSTLDEICREALGFKNLHKLGIYKKARLGNSFRWELTALGYENRFVEEATQRLVVHISRKA